MGRQDPPFKASKGKSFLSPALELRDTDDIETPDHLKNPILPAWCLEAVAPRTTVTIPNRPSEGDDSIGIMHDGRAFWLPHSTILQR